MKIFKLIRKYFADVGLAASQSQQADRLNARNVTILLTFGLNVILAGAYIVYGTTDFHEYVESIFGCSTVAAIAIAFASIVWDMQKIFKFLSNFDQIISKSKTQFGFFCIFVFYLNIKSPILGCVNPISKTIYHSTDRKLHKWIKLLNIALVNVAPICVTLLLFIASFVVYFTTDLGNDAFFLPFTIW